MENKELLNSVLEMAMQKENYDTVTRSIHAINNPDTRKEIFSHLTYKNPYLSAKTVMTMPYNAEAEKDYVLKIIERRLRRAFNEFSRRLFLLALLELEDTEKFELADKGIVDLTNSKTIRYFISNLGIKQQLYFIRLLTGYLE